MFEIFERSCIHLIECAFDHLNVCNTLSNIAIALSILNDLRVFVGWWGVVLLVNGTIIVVC